jgi:hypothetical protein
MQGAAPAKQRQPSALRNPSGLKQNERRVMLKPQTARSARQALEEDHQAREALKAAEADRRAAESAAREARRSAEALAAALLKEAPSPSPTAPATS